VGWEGLYEVSDEGRVRSLDRETPYLARGKYPSVLHVKGRVLKPWLDHYGRPQVELCAGGRQMTRRVCVLVLEAFVGPCPAGKECLHWDDIPAQGAVRHGVTWRHVPLDMKEAA
jgi:NUMOD4 motif